MHASSTSAGRFAAAVPSRAARCAITVVAFAVLTALGARLAVPLPGTPVPFTLQVLFVLLAGALLGPGLGAASQVLYLGAGAAGLPVFAAGAGLPYLLGPTGGYLLALPLAAFLAGLLASPAVLRTAAGLLLGLIAIYAGGVSWLAAWAPVDVALALGLRPFLLADLVKAALALAVVVRYREAAAGFLAR